MIEFFTRGKTVIVKHEVDANDWSPPRGPDGKPMTHTYEEFNPGDKMYDFYKAWADREATEARIRAEWGEPY